MPNKNLLFNYRHWQW